jgi:hypothetical protein
MKRLLLAAALLWVARWGVLVLASYLDRRRPK